jgi:hypothetical protein
MMSDLSVDVVDAHVAVVSEGHPTSRGFYRGHRSWAPSRKLLRAKGCRHGKASEDVGRGAPTTSSRSSVAGATLASPFLWCPQLYAAFRWFSPTSCGGGVPRP